MFARLLSIASVCGVAHLDVTAFAQEQRPAPPLSGNEFQSRDSRHREADEGANPGLLWVEQGSALWKTTAGSGKSCDNCHGDATQSMKGVAARYPAIDAASGKLMNLELRINACRTRHQEAPALAWESNELLALTAFLTRQSLGLPKKVSVEGPARAAFEQGRAFFTTRQGQLNVACTQCHDENVARHLRGDRISQGQTDGWPAYRLEWQTLGSLTRRIRACSLGVRAEILDHGAPEYLALELYLAWRGESLPLSSPGVRR